MFEASRPKKIRLSEAAVAIGTTPKSVRHWISRYGDRGVRPSAEQTGTWFEFSWGDTAALAITKTLVELGMPSFEAFNTAQTALRTRYPELFDDEPCWRVTDINANVLVLGRQGGRWLTNADGQSWGEPGLSSELVIIIQLEQIVQRAFVRLAAMGHIAPAREDTEDPRAQLRIELVQALQRMKALPDQMRKQMDGLQQELNRIYAAFRAMKDPQELLWAIEQTRALMPSLVSPDERPRDPAASSHGKSAKVGRSPRSTRKGK